MGAEGIQQVVARFFALPEDAVMDVPRITLLGDLQLSVQNHRGVRHFTPELLEVETGRGLLSIRGENMVIGSIGQEEIRVVGRICGIGFPD